MYFFGFSLFFAIFGFSENFIKKVGQKLGSNRYNIIKHLLLNKIISNFVNSKKIIVDLLTKGLSRDLVCNSSRNSSRGISLKFLKDERG